MNRMLRNMTTVAFAAAAALAAAAVPANAIKEQWGEIEYACFPDWQGYLTLARRIPGETGWEEKRSNLRVAARDIRFAIDGNGRLHIVCGPDGSRLRYVFSLEQGGLELSPAARMTGDRETRVIRPTLAALDDGSLIFIYNSGTRQTPAITIDWFSLYDGEWVRLHDSLIDPRLMHAAKWNVEVEKSGIIHIAWTNDKKDEYDIVSPDGGLSWQTPEGEKLDLPVH